MGPPKGGIENGKLKNGFSAGNQKGNNSATVRKGKSPAKQIDGGNKVQNQKKCETASKRARKKAELVQLGVFLSDMTRSEERERAEREKMGSVKPMGEPNQVSQNVEGTELAKKMWEEGKAMGLCSVEDDSMVINMLVSLTEPNGEECGEGEGLKNGAINEGA